MFFRTNAKNDSVAGRRGHEAGALVCGEHSAEGFGGGSGRRNQPVDATPACAGSSAVARRRPGGFARPIADRRCGRFSRATTRIDSAQRSRCHRATVVDQLGGPSGGPTPPPPDTKSAGLSSGPVYGDGDDVPLGGRRVPTWARERPSRGDGPDVRDANRTWGRPVRACIGGAEPALSCEDRVSCLAGDCDSLDVWEVGPSGVSMSSAVSWR